MDGSVAGRGCMALMIHVVEKGRALPRAWRVRHGPQGHFPADLHSALIELVSGLIPAGAQGGCLGDGACAGTRLQQTGEGDGWSYVCRTGCHRTAWGDSETLRRDTLGAGRKPGPLVACSAVLLTREAYGSLRRLCGWATGCTAPLSLGTHMDAAEEACRLYSKRFRLEPCFSD